ncbi:hypothetical protein, partial [Mycobacterium lacus]|uniref:hypothetical protein n=1 Tax=Mycobacterium lacus TaxID=169765 RepID=UPI0021F25DAF
MRFHSRGGRVKRPLEPLHRLDNPAAFAAQLRKRPAGQSQCRDIEHGLAERLIGVGFPVIPMDDVLTELLPRFQDRGSIPAAEAHQRRHPRQHLLPGAVPADRIDRGAQGPKIPRIFGHCEGFLAKAFELLPMPIDRPAHRVGMQELIPLLGGVAAHRGDRRLRLRNHAGDLGAQRIRFAAKLL